MRACVRACVLACVYLSCMPWPLHALSLNHTPCMCMLLQSSSAKVVLYSSMVVKAFAQCSAFTGAIIMVNAAPQPEQLGDVNGVGQTLAALVRGIGPAMGGIMWAASLDIHSAGQQFLPFAVIAVVAVVNWVLFGCVTVPGLDGSDKQAASGAAAAE